MFRTISLVFVSVLSLNACGGGGTSSGAVSSSSGQENGTIELTGGTGTGTGGGLSHQTSVASEILSSLTIVVKTIEVLKSPKFIPERPLISSLVLCDQSTSAGGATVLHESNVSGSIEQEGAFKASTYGVGCAFGGTSYNGYTKIMYDQYIDSSNYTRTFTARDFFLDNPSFGGKGPVQNGTQTCSSERGSVGGCIWTHTGFSADRISYAVTADSNRTVTGSFPASVGSGGNALVSLSQWTRSGARITSGTAVVDYGKGNSANLTVSSLLDGRTSSVVKLTINGVTVSYQL